MNLSNLEFFILTMNVLNGNMDVCKEIPYAYIQNRKHYNLKDKELSKIKPVVPRWQLWNN